MRLVEIVRGLPRWTVPAGASVLVVAILLVVALTRADDGTLATNPGTSSGVHGVTDPSVDSAAGPRPGSSITTIATSTTTTTTTAPPTTVDIDDEYEPGAADPAAVLPREI